MATVTKATTINCRNRWVIFTDYDGTTGVGTNRDPVNFEDVTGADLVILRASVPRIPGFDPFQPISAANRWPEEMEDYWSDNYFMKSPYQYPFPDSYREAMQKAING